MSELILWKNFIAGDNEAFEEIYASYFDFLYNYSYRLTGNVDLVKELIQDLFVRILVNRKTLGDCENIGAYLTRALRNKIIDHLKLKKNTVNVEELPLDFITDDMICTQSDDLDDESIKTRIKLNHILKKLPSRQREMLYLRYVKELSHKEIADIMEMEPQSVKNLLLRAKTKIRELYT